MPRSPSPSASLPAARRRVLASPARIRVLEVVAQHPGGIDAGSIAPRVGLHVNTVRGHLEVLEHVGLVGSDLEDRHHRGRPRRLFKATPTSPEGLSDGDGPFDGDGQGAYRALAAALAEVAHDPSPDREGAVIAAGSRWGRELVAGETPVVAATPQQPAPAALRDRLVELLDRLGFAPSAAAPDRIELHRCPFLDLAREHPEVVCGLHRGILAGALESLGHDGEIELDPFTTPTTCDVRLGNVA